MFPYCSPWYSQPHQPLPPAAKLALGLRSSRLARARANVRLSSAPTRHPRNKIIYKYVMVRTPRDKCRSTMHDRVSSVRSTMPVDVEDAHASGRRPDRDRTAVGRQQYAQTVNGGRQLHPTRRPAPRGARGGRSAGLSTFVIVNTHAPRRQDIRNDSLRSLSQPPCCGRPLSHRGIIRTSSSSIRSSTLDGAWTPSRCTQLGKPRSLGSLGCVLAGGDGHRRDRGCGRRDKRGPSDAPVAQIRSRANARAQIL